MKLKLEKKMQILTSVCDNTSKLSYPAIFSLFMDMATQHGAEMGLGMEQLAPKGLFWLTLKTKVQIAERPKLMDTVELSSWPEEPGRLRCNRYYVISNNGKTLVCGKTEWAIVEGNSGKVQKLADVYPQDTPHLTDVVCEEPFARISEDFSDCELLDTYKVKSTDIDLAQHMNNAAYLKVIFAAFTCKQLEEMNIREVEISYRTPCYEGEVLSLRSRNTENGLEIGVIKADGKTAVTARIIKNCATIK